MRSLLTDLANIATKIRNVERGLRVAVFPILPFHTVAGRVISFPLLLDSIHLSLIIAFSRSLSTV